MREYLNDRLTLRGKMEQVSGISIGKGLLTFYWDILKYFYILARVEGWARG